MSSSNERLVKSYLTPKNSVMVAAIKRVENISKSEIVNIALKQYIENLSKERHEKYLAAISEL